MMVKFVINEIMGTDKGRKHNAIDINVDPRIIQKFIFSNNCIEDKNVSIVKTTGCLRKWLMIQNTATLFVWWD